MKTKLMVMLLLCVGIFGGYAVGQGEATGAAKTFLYDVIGIDSTGMPIEGAIAAQRAATAVMGAPENREVVQQAIRMGMAGKGKDDTLLLAVEVAQNQKIIEQNTRIIELLEKQAK